MSRKTAATTQDAFRDGFFHRGKGNPHKYASRLWEVWEIGRYHQKEGLGYFNIFPKDGSSYNMEDGRIVSVLYGRRGAFKLGVEDRLPW